MEFLINSNKEDNMSIGCDVLKETYFDSIDTLEDSRSNLEEYINNANSREKEFERIKEKYGFTQITYWILGKQIEGQCGGDFSHTILYFYLDEEQCPACEDQGVILSYVKQKLGDDVLIFSLDANKGGVIELLGKSYEIFNNGFPVLVINDEVVKGFSSKKEILSLLEGE